MPGFRNACRLLLCLTIWSGLPCTAAPFERVDIPVALGDGVTTVVETAWPAAGAPRALVIVVPGTGGLSDPYLNAELRKPVYDPDSRGGMTAKLLAAGYAVAYYNHRGYAPLRTCIRGDTLADRAASFVHRCVDPTVRAWVTLSSITADTARVFGALERHPRTKGLPQVALAFSEGMHHVSTLVGKGNIHPLGIVSVGGPHIPFADAVRYQTTYEYFVKIAQEAFKHCPENELTVDRIFSCAPASTSPDRLSKMRELAGGNVLARNFLPLRRELFLFQYRAAPAYFKSLPPNTTMAGSFEGVLMPVAWNAHFPEEQMAATRSSVDQLGAFGGRIVYLFGALDYLSPLPASGSCRSPVSGASPPPDCTFRLVAGVGHGLEDANGFVPATILDDLVRTVDEVFTHSRQ